MPERDRFRKPVYGITDPGGEQAPPQIDGGGHLEPAQPEAQPGAAPPPNARVPGGPNGQGTCTINTSAGKHGSIEPSGPVAVRRGTAATFRLVPDPDCEVKQLLVDGKAAAEVSYTFANVTDDHAVSVSFAKKTDWHSPAFKYFCALIIFALIGSASYFLVHYLWNLPRVTDVDRTILLAKDLQSALAEEPSGIAVIRPMMNELDVYTRVLLDADNSTLPASVKKPLAEFVSLYQPSFDAYEAVASEYEAAVQAYSAAAEQGKAAIDAALQVLDNKSRALAQNAGANAVYMASVRATLRGEQSFFWNTSQWRYLEAVFWALAGMLVNFFIHIGGYLRTWHSAQIIRHIGLLIAFPAIAFVVVVLASTGSTFAEGTVQVDWANPYLFAAISFVIGLQADRAINWLSRLHPLGEEGEKESKAASSANDDD